MAETITGFAYLVAGVFFILALRGLSSPDSSRMGNIFGIAGMVIAVITTLAQSGRGQLRDDHPRHLDRWFHRYRHRAQDQHDLTATAGCCLS